MVGFLFAVCCLVAADVLVQALRLKEERRKTMMIKILNEEVLHRAESLEWKLNIILTHVTPRT